MKKALLLAFVSMFAMQAHASTEELIGSVKSNNFPKVLELLNNGENVNEADASGTTALHYAIAYDNAEMTQVLLSYGADLTKANNKGWTPLKIAEQKDLKNVTPVLVQYLQLQKQNKEEKTATENNKPAEKQVVESIEIVQDVPASDENAPAVEEVVVSETVESAPAVEEVVVPETVESEPVVQNTEEKVKTAESTDQEAPVITMSEYQNMVNEAQNQIVAAKEAQAQAENSVNALNDEIAKIKAEKEALAKALAEERENKAKTESKESAEKTDAPKTEESKAENQPVKTEKTAKKEPKAVKPILHKKPAYKAPQPEKVVVKPSAMVDGIYAGDEEIVYCLDYLGNGDEENMKRAAGHFAASVSISEPRYKQIVDKANEFFLKAGDEEMNKRNDECSKIIFPADKNKQNQIIRSMNKSVGY